ncbi:MAG: methyltransferase domain-containing protein [Betaproteobacteria bacterium]|nr:methyltransferase domain-containing protein [Betaproteobacteria bacterium]
MAETQIRFDDGESYERYMGDWSQRAGKVFLEWLAAPSGLKWIDVGCGNGAFTELLVEQCKPAAVHGIDPSEGQLAFARSRPAAHLAKFDLGEAMALPFPAKAFDAAIMALVIFFVPNPAKGVAEMVRVVRPGGVIAAYAWDILGGGFTLEPVRIELRAMGIKPADPPSVEASRIEVMRDLWTKAGLDAVETRQITVQRTFSNFEEFWAITVSGSPSLRPTLAEMSPADVELFKMRVCARLPADAAGRITYESRANAVKGRVPV